MVSTRQSCRSCRAIHRTTRDSLLHESILILYRCDATVMVFGTCRTVSQRTTSASTLCPCCTVARKIRHATQPPRHRRLVDIGGSWYLSFSRFMWSLPTRARRREHQTPIILSTPTTSAPNHPHQKSAFRTLLCWTTCQFHCLCRQIGTKPMRTIVRIMKPS